MNLDLKQFSYLNAERCKRWHPGFPSPDLQGWSGADWSNAMQGEVGELAEIFALLVAASGKSGNIVKKIRRADAGMRGILDKNITELRADLAEEIADVVTYDDLLATYYGIDLLSALAQKFNKVSDLQGFPEKVKY